MIICIDFDGTCVQNEYPAVGAALPLAVEKLQALTAAGHKLILYTMRDKQPLKDAIAWFAANNIPLWGVNNNPTQGWTTSPKVFAHVYIDDLNYGTPLVYPKNGRPYVDWSKVNI